MSTQIDIQPRRFDDYVSTIGEEAAEEIRYLAGKLKGARVLHVNATAVGGGVAELLVSLVPLMNDLGLATEWKVMKGSRRFFDVTKALHNTLQGMDISVTPAMWRLWRYYNKRNAELMKGDYDFAVVHDPQPAGLLAYTKKRTEGIESNKWIWRCHIDLTTPQAQVWKGLQRYLVPYDATVFTLEGFINRDAKLPRPTVSPPGIDPLSEKNKPLSRDLTDYVLNKYGVDTTRPYILQAARMDLWKDPLGVLEAYRIVKKEIPEVQLVYLAAMANDDPEGWVYYETTVKAAGSDPDIHLFPNVVYGIGDAEVSAFQTGAAVILQKSLREGFGLSVTEALWKARPVIAGRVGGIPLQVIDGETGYLVDSPQECADRIIRVLKDEKLGQRLGEAGREHARKNYLITRYLRDYLKLFLDLTEGPEISRNGRETKLPQAVHGED